jgi:hypothetical protein
MTDFTASSPKKSDQYLPPDASRNPYKLQTRRVDGNVETADALLFSNRVSFDRVSYSRERDFTSADGRPETPPCTTQRRCRDNSRL